MKKKMAFLMSVVIAIVGCASSGVLRSWPEAFGTAAYADETVHMSARLDMSELYGYADTQGQGLMTTTGGGSAKPQVVTTLAQLKSLVEDDIPRVVVISGTIKCPDWPVDVGSNKTIVGIDDNATLNGGFNIKNASNVIVCNLNVKGTLPGSGPDDTFNIEASHHIWLNHLNVWNSKDGSIDIKQGADYITVSWCKLWYEKADSDAWIAAGKKDHRLACLIGSGAGDHDDTDMGKLHVTYHHNWFSDYVNERMPRVMYGRAHIFNNYYSCEGNAYCIGADSYASVLVENNYFYKVKNPHEFSYPENKNLPAAINARGNEYVQTSGKKDSGQKTSGSSVKLFETTVYDYMLNDAKDVPEVVQSYVGPKDLSDQTAIPQKLKDAKKVSAVQEEAPTINPNATPLPTLPPINQKNDNPVTYDASNKTYTYHGQNSDQSNAYYTIDNPFKNKDFKETPQFVNGYPKWTKGATVSYWVKAPSGAQDAVVLNFNLENDRQMQREDAYKYNMCKAYSLTDESYSMGSEKIYVDGNGKEYRTLSGYGKNVQYNPNYPVEGLFTTSNKGGAILAYEKGKDSSVSANWQYLNYIGEGYYKNYSLCYDEAGGSDSKVAEAYISGSFSMYASGSLGYRQDSKKGRQINPYLDNYASELDAHQFNQFYYWGNGSAQTLKGSSLKTPTMEKKNDWHFVVAVIKNDWVQYYMDGIKITTDYINYWGDSLTSNVNSAGQGFNLGYGNSVKYRTNNPSPGFSTGMSLLDFISDKDTVLTIGGLGAGAENLSQHTIGTPDGTQIKDLEFYDIPVEEKCILKDKINLELAQPSPSPTPVVTPGVTKNPTSTTGPVVTKEPTQTQTAEATKAPTQTEAAGVTKEPTPTQTAGATKEPAPTQTVDVTKEPTPTQTADVTKEPTPTQTADVTKEPAPTQTADVTKEPTPTQTADVTKEPAPTQTAGATKEPAPTEAAETTKPPAAPTATQKIDKDYRLGDINNDGFVNLEDANAALRIALGIDKVSGEKAFKAGDVNLDGFINLDDANLILKAALAIAPLEQAALKSKLGL